MLANDDQIQTKALLRVKNEGLPLNTVVSTCFFLLL